MLKIALPNKGSLSEDAVQLIREAGYNCRRYSRELIVCDSRNQVEFVFLRPRDIAIYVSKGILDLGVTGRDLTQDSGADVEELLPLGFGRSDFCYAVPADTGLTPDQLAGRRIATSYPQLVSEDLQRRGFQAEIIRLDGAVEISVRLGVADAIADVVQTGRTLHAAGLKVVGPPLLQSEAILVARSQAITANEAVYLFIERIRGIVVAREYVMVEYDIPEAMLEMACVITPGIESPTVSPLSKKGWVAVKSMSRQQDVNPIMDRLTKLGAKGIIVTDIRTCRI
ncbi:ATP phosphoribosyltransferase [Desulfosarcina ovata subsp. sediminis]|uniref:ATP phosphoribosyltransferase n=1 Tax=Desulfosarcina ovata subsp. sediminis TaxID=885957 RepID=A0A5K7ZZ27_9BACT|nr:ATP phosphoribosyltransferase [Desulfosarcina ovata]BBO85391.1 ATP phosphoribosyltransferase [Desulfosarcina ovata subsp. sediminis]